MVHVRDPRARWCVPAARVSRIVSAAEWRADGERPDAAAATVLDPLAPLGPLPIDDDQQHRVIVLHGERDHHDLAVIAAGAIQIGDVDASDVLLLPPELTGIAAFTAIIAVGTQQLTTPGALTDRAVHHTLSLVIDPLALSAVALTPLAPPVTTPPPRRGVVSKRNHA